jgi:hypothetical protein
MTSYWWAVSFQEKLMPDSLMPMLVSDVVSHVWVNLVWTL